MADKVVLTSVDIGVDEAIKDSHKLKQEIERLKTETANLKKTQGETSKEYIQSLIFLKIKINNFKLQNRMIDKILNIKYIDVDYLNESELIKLKNKLIYNIIKFSKSLQDEFKGI